MNTLPAYDEIALEFGGNTVFLRPSLRAAIRLERMHDGFPALLNKIEELDTRTVWSVITAAAGKTATDDLFAYAATQPLSRFAQAAQAPLFDLVAALLPEQPDAKASTATGTPSPWSQVYRELFKIATGWLGWPPDTAWNATPQEITDAFSAHIDKLKAIHGSGDDEPTGQTEEQRQHNVELGLDPEFDRSGLHALSGLGKL